MKKKIIAVMLGIILFGGGGCGYDKPAAPKPPPQSKPAQENHVERKMEVDEALDTNIEVTKDEMDRFIAVAKNYKLTEGEVRRLVQIFKQVGMNFDSRLRISIKPVTDQKLQPLGRIEYDTVGYTVECQYPGTKPQIIIDGKSRNASGYYVLTYNGTEKDFEIYFEFLFVKGLCPIYKNHRVIETADTLSCTVTDAAFDKMYNAIVGEASSKGKFVEIQKFYERMLSREFTPEEYEQLLNGKKPEGIEELENVTVTGVKVLKDSAQLFYQNNAPCIIVFPDVIVESNVYGEGKKKFYGNFHFRADGTLIKATLTESSKKVN